MGTEGTRSRAVTANPAPVVANPFPEHDLASILDDWEATARRVLEHPDTERMIVLPQAVLALVTAVRKLQAVVNALADGIYACVICDKVQGNLRVRRHHPGCALAELQGHTL